MSSPDLRFAVILGLDPRISVLRNSKIAVIAREQSDRSNLVQNSKAISFKA
ncbi:MAG: hypothetical protein MR878_03995 [Campylobacter sp.]|nr:hypothetical protein [Campylobacter sp.]